MKNATSFLLPAGRWASCAKVKFISKLSRWSSASNCSTNQFLTSQNNRGASAGEKLPIIILVSRSCNQELQVCNHTSRDVSRADNEERGKMGQRGKTRLIDNCLRLCFWGLSSIFNVPIWLTVPFKDYWGITSCRTVPSKKYSTIAWLFSFVP